MASAIYLEIRDKVAIQMSTCKFSYDSRGIIVEDDHMSRKEYWDTVLTEDQRDLFCCQAQAAMGVFDEYTWKIIMESSWEQYLSTK